ncbi:glycoside hydrolase family 20 catalytic core [Firmicutes bacterium CAG:791]|nr:glycoside hydrolase family 20 catalytic core [Firmicutes bacterium CAG:791]
MKIRDIKGIDPELIQEIAPALERGADTEAYALTAEQGMEAGYRYTKSDGVLHMVYGTKPDLCRALLAAAGSTAAEGKSERWLSEIGYMADCSRNAVARVDTLKKLVRQAALMGYHFIGLYLEDTLAIPEEPYFGYMRGAYTKEEIAEVVRYAALFGVEIRPYVETLAHLNQITRYEHYQKFIDTDDILLAGDERTYEFLDHYLKAVSDAFPSRRVNLGMDEAHMVGLGKYLDAHGYQNRVEIIQKHLERVMEICRKYGLQPQMWSDMFFRLAFGGEYYVKDKPMAENVKIPEGLELVYWDYYSADEEHYDDMLRQHRKMTDKVSFAGGVWKWIGFAPHNRYSAVIGKAALSSCRRNGITSVVMTGWGDNGGEASQFSILPGLFEDARLVYEDNLPEAAFYALTGIREEDYMKLDLSNPLPAREDRVNNAGKFLFYNDALLGIFDPLAQQLASGYYEDAAKQLEQAVRDSSGSSLCYVLKTQASLCRVLQDKANLGTVIRTAYDAGDREKLRDIAEEAIPQLLGKLDRFYQDFRKQWMSENKAFGFEVQSLRIGGLRQRILEVQQRLEEYLSGEIAEIDELEKPVLPFAYCEGADVTTLDYNRWNYIVTTAVIG